MIQMVHDVVYVCLYVKLMDEFMEEVLCETPKRSFVNKFLYFVYVWVYD